MVLVLLHALPAFAQDEPPQPLQDSTKVVLTPKKWSMAGSVFALSPLVQLGLDIDYQLSTTTYLEGSLVARRNPMSDNTSDTLSVRYKSFVGQTFYYFAGLGLRNSKWREISPLFPSTDGGTQILSAQDFVADLGIGSRWVSRSQIFVEIDWAALQAPLFATRRASAVYRSEHAANTRPNSPPELSLIRVKIGRQF